MVNIWNYKTVTRVTFGWLRVVHMTVWSNLAVGQDNVDLENAQTTVTGESTSFWSEAELYHYNCLSAYTSFTSQHRQAVSEGCLTPLGWLGEAEAQESRFATIDSFPKRGQASVTGPRWSGSFRFRGYHSAPNCSSKSRCWKHKQASSRSVVVSILCCENAGKLITLAPGWKSS